MKNLLYVTFVDYKEKKFLGVIKKIEFQLRAFTAAGMECTLVGQYGSGAVVIAPDGQHTVMENTAGISKRKFLADAAAAQLDAKEYTGAYIRFQFFCNNMEAMLKNMKAHGLRVLLEIPTYPYEPELILQGIKGIPKLVCDKLFRRRCYRNIDLVGVSNSVDNVYGVPTFCMKNGLCMEDFKLTEYGYYPERLDMISVSSMMRWHGLERVMQGMADYYAAGGDREVVLHAVGDGIERERYESIAKELGLEDKVIFYGSLFGEQLDEVYDKCSVGLCALTAHRKNMTEGTPLKTVEYAARGLAIVTEMKLLFLEDDCDFCLQIPFDDSPMDINAVIEMNDRLFADNYPEARKRIRNAVEEKCDMKRNMLPAIEFFTKM